MERLSLIINNYNYGRFLSRCIDSILGQLGPADELIVVDDGSTDNSREIIGGYRNSILAIPKANGGQASAMNAGFAASKGDWIWFVDADDWLSPNALRAIRPQLAPEYTRVQGWLETIDPEGRSLSVMPKALKARQVLVPQQSIRSGQLPPFPPTSGNVFSRVFLKEIFPIPEEEFRICADEYLVYSGIRLQRILHIPRIIGYRGSHEANAHLMNTLFYTDTKRAELRLETLKRTRKLILSQYPEYETAPDTYPYALNHLKAAAVIQRFLPERASELVLDRSELKRQFRRKLDAAGPGWVKIRESLSYLILMYFPGPMVRLAGFLETRLKSLYFKKPE